MLKRLESEELRVTVLAYEDAQSRQALPDCGQWHNTGDAMLRIFAGDNVRRVIFVSSRYSGICRNTVVINRWG